MTAYLRFLLLSFLVLLGIPGKAAQCLVLGDSLSKEYEVEFPALFPTNPASWAARNWIEILHERRNAWFDLGRFSGYVDPRITGHEHNWAFPGATTRNIRDQLSDWRNIWWRVELEDQLKNAVERVVIFAGGNDVNSYYGQIYNGAAGTSQINKTRDNLKWIVKYVKGVKKSLPIVLVSVPHVGCTPKVQQGYPTDPVKTARMTAALERLNSELAVFAQAEGIGFVPGVYQLTKDLISEPFVMSGVAFYKQADPDSRPRYVFSGDGFHPATAPHGKIAQMVIEAFRAKYPAQITPLTDREIVSNILGLDGDVPFKDWIAQQGVPPDQAGLLADPDGDGLNNALEFTFEGASASASDFQLLTPQREAQHLVWTYRIRPEAREWAGVILQQSRNLKQWTEVPASQIITNSDGSQTVRLPIQDRRFLRMKLNR